MQQNNTTVAATTVENVRIVCGAESAYACVKGPSYSMDVRLSGGRSAVARLRERAEEEKARAEAALIRAARIAAAADWLEAN